MNKEGSFINVEDDDITLILAELVTLYGYDFSNYSKASLRRRINRIVNKDKIVSIAEFRYKLVHDELYFNHFLEEVTVNVTEMFRDPIFFKSLRENVLPHLKTYPLIRIWHAGCSTGEEVYSLAILLKEEGLLERTLLYATDINQHVLESAQSGAFSIENMTEYTRNYIKSGGKKDFSSYYSAKYGKAIFSSELKNRMVFSTHNLVTDQSFNEFNLIVCRNVLIYFNPLLQNKVVNLFNDSLSESGHLALGSKESIRSTTIESNFKNVDIKQKIWQKNS